MSWSDRAFVATSGPALAAATRAAGLALALGLSGLTAGCFQPLYGEAAHPGLVQALREIEVTPIPDRMGHYLADNLITRLNGSGETPKPRYRLTVKLSRSITTPTIESQIQTADAATVTGTAVFWMCTTGTRPSEFSPAATTLAFS